MSLSKSSFLSSAYSALGRPVVLYERPGVSDYELYCLLGERDLLRSTDVRVQHFVDDLLEHALSDEQVAWRSCRVKAETLAIELHTDEIYALVHSLPQDTLEDMGRVHQLIKDVIKESVLVIMPSYNSPPDW